MTYYRAGRLKVIMAAAGVLSALAMTLTACGHLAAVSAQATSSSMQADRNAAKAGVSTILPAKYQTTSGLIGLAFHPGEARALAEQLGIPKSTAQRPDNR